MAVEANALGDYLRARRQQVRPEDVGLAPGARRRVAGLRREELAMLAGISAEYYLRLEVGRDKNPSPQVVDALARALRLDTKATQHLHNLANPTGTATPDLEVTRAYALTELVDQFLMPAIVANRYLVVCPAINR
jgi:transcriptional regulator with XRE-family HTH domain